MRMKILILMKVNPKQQTNMFTVNTDQLTFDQAWQKKKKKKKKESRYFQNQ